MGTCDESHDYERVGRKTQAKTPLPQGRLAGLGRKLESLRHIKERTARGACLLLLRDFDDVSGGWVVSESGEVVAAECEFEEEGFIGGSLEFPA